MSLPTIEQTRRRAGSGREYGPCTHCQGYHPSATTINQVIAKPALLGYMAKKEREACLTAFQQVYESGLPDSWPKIFSQIDGVLGREKAGAKAARKAADIGTEAHGLIEHWLRQEMGQDVGPAPEASDGAQWAFMLAQDWWRSQDLVPEMVEQVVFACPPGVAGTMDVLAKDKRGRHYVVDWKTGSSGIYAEAFLQNSWYQMGVHRMGLVRSIAGGIIIRLPREAMAETEFEVASVPMYEALEPICMAALTLWGWWKQA